MATIKTYLAAVRHLHLISGPDTPFSDARRPLLQLLLRGIKRATSKMPTKSRLPITPDILLKVGRVIQQSPHSQDTLMVWAPMNTCFFGFLQAGEVCAPSTSTFDPSWHLCVGDLAVDSLEAPAKIFVTIKASKTDPFREGVTITLGKTDQKLCPLTALLPFVALRGAQKGPLFRFADGSFLTRQRFVEEVRQLLTTAGIDPSPYSGHSFRIGATTTAACAGMDAALIQTLGRWKSSAYQLYIRIPRSSLAAVSKALVSQPRTAQE